MPLDKYIEKNIDRITSWRRKIHSRPELAFNEIETSEFVAAKLSEFGIEIHRGIGKTGVVGVLQKGTSKKNIGLRADMDALPIKEQNNFAHRSQNEGCMHACGHDGHTAMLLGAAEYLSKTGNFNGTIYFIFQPAEEGEAGAKAMIEDGLFSKFNIDCVFAIHNWPHLDPGVIRTRSGPIMAGFDTFSMNVIGDGGHAALPHLSSDTVTTTASIILNWQTIVSRNIDPIESVVLSVTQIKGGNTWAVIPKTTSIGGTVRTFSRKNQIYVKRRMEEIARAIAVSNGCNIDFNYEEKYPPTVNSKLETELVLQVADHINSPKTHREEYPPVTGSEDFGFMLEEKKGCYALIGNGDTTGGCMLHSPTYDFNDMIIPQGITYWVNLVNRKLHEKEG